MTQRHTLLALALATAFPSVCHAEDDDVQLAPVVTTATRSAKVVSEAPASVTVVTDKQIENDNVKRVDDALSSTAGVYVKGLGDGTPSNFSNQIVMRGIPGYYRTAVMIDGQVLNDGFSGGVNTSTVPIESIQQIEVVPGPYSALYGGNAMGGVVNIITKTPTKREVSLTGGYGSNNQHRESVFYQDKINDVLGISLNLVHAASDGYVNDYATYTGTTTGSAANTTGATATTDAKGSPVYLVGDKGNKGWWQDNAGIKLFLTPGTQERLTVEASHSDVGITYPDSFNCYLSQPCTATRIIDDNGTSKSIAVRQQGLLSTPNGQETYRYALGYETVLASDYKLKIDVGYKTDDYWYVQTTSNSTLTGGTGSYSDLPSTRLDLSAVLSFPLGDRHFLTLGAFANRFDLHKKNYALSNWRDNDLRGTVFYQSNGETSTQALALQDEFTLDERTTLYFGGRYDSWTTSGRVRQSILSGYTTAAFDNTYEERNADFFSPKVSAVYKLAERATLRAAWGMAFHAPTLSDMYSTSGSTSGGKTSTTQANPNLKPETSTSWEIGGDYQLTPQTLLRATYYETELKDLLYTVNIVNTSTQYTNEWQNVGTGMVKGIEVEVRHTFGEGLSGFISASDSTSILTQAKTAALASYEGRQLRFIPRRMVNIGVDGQHGKWFGSLVGHYVSKAYGDHQNLDTVDGVSGSYDAYCIANIKIGYHFDPHWTASLAIDNLADVDYYQSSKMPGRTAFASVNYKF